MWTVFTVLGASLTLRYALRSRRAPTERAVTETIMERASGADLAVMGVVLATMAWVIYGVTQRQYYLPELAAQFFAMGLAAGLVAWLGRRPGLDANALAEAFRDGAAQMLPVVLVVALAKALILLLGGTDPSQPAVLNTLLYQLAHTLEGLPAALAAL